MKQEQHLLIIRIILFSISQLYSQSKNDSWRVESQITKRIGNVNFNFPENFSDLDRRESLIKETLVSIEEIGGFVETQKVILMK